jgi:hypothetical protein
MATITVGGGSTSSGGGNNNDIIFTTGVTSRPVITLADTEQTLSLPIGTKAFMLKNVGNVSVRYAYTSGGTASAYVTLAPHASKWIDKLDATARFIYVRSSVAGHQLELEYWV